MAFDGIDLSLLLLLSFVFCCGGDSKSDIFVVDIFSRTRSEIFFVLDVVVGFFGRVGRKANST